MDKIYIADFMHLFDKRSQWNGLFGSLFKTVAILEEMNK